MNLWDIICWTSGITLLAELLGYLTENMFEG